MNPSDLFTLFRQEAECGSGCIAGWKAGFSAILLVEGLVFGHLVYLLRLTGKRFYTIVDLGHALSAGIFLSTGLLHILPEAVELFEGGHSHDDEEEHEDDLEHSERNEEGEEHHEDEHEEGEHEEGEHEEGEHHHEEEGHDDEEEEEGGLGALVWAFLIVMITYYALFFIEQVLLPKVLSSRSAEKVEGEATNDVEEGAVETAERSEVAELGGFKSRAFATGFIEILGISAHSLFESMALGLSTQFDTVLNIFIAVASHRWATAAAIAFKLVTVVKYFPFLVLLLTFSAIIPIGVGIGAGLSNLSDDFQAVLFAISAGTFVYLGAYEGMAEGFGPGKTNLLGKFAAAVSGAAIIVAITVILKVLDIHG